MLRTSLVYQTEAGLIRRQSRHARPRASDLGLGRARTAGGGDFFDLGFRILVRGNGFGNPGQG